MEISKVIFRKKWDDKITVVLNKMKKTSLYFCSSLDSKSNSKLISVKKRSVLAPKTLAILSLRVELPVLDTNVDRSLKNGYIFQSIESIFFLLKLKSYNIFLIIFFALPFSNNIGA